MAGGTLCSTEKGFTVRERHPPIRAYVSGSVTEKDVERIQINPRCLISGRSLKQRHETTSPVSAFYKGESQEKKLPGDWKEQRFFPGSPAHVIWGGSWGFLFSQLHVVVVPPPSLSH